MRGPTIEARSDARSALVERLGEAGCGREAGRVGVLNLLARSGLPMPEGVVLTGELHRRFLEAGGLLPAIEEYARSGRGSRREVGRASGRNEARRRAAGLRREYRAAEAPEREIREAVIGLGGRTVAVISEDVTRIGIRTIPRAMAAVRAAWLSPGGLERQARALARGEELPTWPVLIQRELGNDERP